MSQSLESKKCSESSYILHEECLLLAPALICGSVEIWPWLEDILWGCCYSILYEGERERESVRLKRSRNWPQSFTLRAPQILFRHKEFGNNMTLFGLRNNWVSKSLAENNNHLYVLYIVPILGPSSYLHYANSYKRDTLHLVDCKKWKQKGGLLIVDSDII